MKTEKQKRDQEICLTGLISLAVQNLSVGGALGEVMDHLKINGVIQPYVAEYISQSTTVKRDQARNLHSTVMKGGTTAFEGYYWSMVRAGGLDELTKRMFDLLDHDILRSLKNYDAGLHELYKQEHMAASNPVPAQYAPPHEPMPLYIKHGDELGSGHASNKGPPPPPGPMPGHLGMSGGDQVDSHQASNNVTSENQPATLCPESHVAVAVAPTPPPGDLPDKIPRGDELCNMEVRKCNIDDPVVQKNLLSNDVFPLPRGHALLINIESYKGSSQQVREGTEMDGKYLKRTLKDLHFKVKQKWNETGERIMDLVKEASQTELSKKCFVCVLMSHGDSGVVYDRDGERVAISDIIQQAIDGVDNPATPKVFVIQACQGDVKSYKDLGNKNKQETSMDEGAPDQSLSSLRDLQAGGTGEPAQQPSQEPSAEPSPECASAPSPLASLRDMQAANKKRKAAELQQKQHNEECVRKITEGIRSIKDNVFLLMATIDGCKGCQVTRHGQCTAVGYNGGQPL